MSALITSGHVASIPSMDQSKRHSRMKKAKVMINKNKSSTSQILSRSAKPASLCSSSRESHARSQY